MRIEIIAIVGVFFCAPLAADNGFTGLVDPTRPLGTPVMETTVAESAPAGPVLQSTMVAPQSRRAVISGKTYIVGDRLGAAVITDIRPYEVILDQGGRESRLRLFPALVKGAAISPAGDTKGATP